MISSNEYTKYNPLYLCCSIVSYSGQHYGIEKFAKNISKTFGINLRNFENIIQELKNLLYLVLYIFYLSLLTFDNKTDTEVINTVIPNKTRTE